MKVALDEAVPQKTIKVLEQNGFNVVYQAKKGEMDQSWFDVSVHLGAEIFVSADTDIIVMAGNAGFSFIELPQKVGGAKLTDYILQKVKVIHQIKTLYQKHPEICYCRRS